MNNRKLLVLGAGESGVGTAILAQKKGFEVLVSDLGKIKDSYRQMLINSAIEFEEQTHQKAFAMIEAVDETDEILEVVKSPGIPDKVPIIKTLRDKGINVISEIEFAGRYTKAKTICITGSNGKTTTTMLTYHLLKNGGVNVGLAGNVGKSFALQVAEDNHDYYVLELSSFQLDGMYEFKADIAVITNITPDHLDRYEYVFQKYIDSKFRILQNQTINEHFIYWASDPVIKTEMEHRRIASNIMPFDIEQSRSVKAFIEQGHFTLFTPDNELFLSIPKDKLALKGIHNTYNSMAAGLVAMLVGVSPGIIADSLSTFEGVSHRMEYVATVDGVRYINDSKATNVNSCYYALQSMQTPVVLILGGTDKGNDYNEISAFVREKVKHLVFLGVDNEKLIEFFGNYKTAEGLPITYHEARSMDEAVRQSSNLAQSGDTVLLSPCCASFDLFDNYEDRGNRFKNSVLAMNANVQ